MPWIVVASFQSREPLSKAMNTLKKHKIKYKTTRNFMDGEIELRVLSINSYKTIKILRSVGIGDLYIRTYWLT